MFPEARTAKPLAAVVHRSKTPNTGTVNPMNCYQQHPEPIKLFYDRQAVIDINL